MEQRAIEPDDLTLDLDLIAEIPPPPELDLVELRRLVPFVLRREGATGDWSVAVVLTNDAHLRALHRDFMGIDSPTDVMTFPAGDGVPGQAALSGGDVVVSVDRAAEQATEVGHSVAAEVRFLVVHGLLHLCGWDDATDALRERMHDRQTDLLGAFAREGA